MVKQTKKFKWPFFGISFSRSWRHQQSLNNNHANKISALLQFVSVNRSILSEPIAQFAHRPYIPDWVHYPSQVLTGGNKTTIGSCEYILFRTTSLTLHMAVLHWLSASACLWLTSCRWSGSVIVGCSVQQPLSDEHPQNRIKTHTKAHAQASINTKHSGLYQTLADAVEWNSRGLQISSKGTGTSGDRTPRLAPGL